MNKDRCWQHFHHDADIGIRARARSLSAVFSQAALAMSAVITDLSLIENKTCITIKCEGNDPEYLFVDWLNALIYEMAVRHMLFIQFDVVINNGILTATVCGENIDRKKHHPAVEIKGATFTELKVAEDDRGNWSAQCVLDV